jgi:stage II sporulation protein AA (anti-sigma F factor antagonist)
MDGDFQTEVVLVNGHVVLAARGEIDIATAPEFERACHRLTAFTENLTLDLSDVTFMDSSGLMVLLGAHGNGTSSRIQILNPSHCVVRLLKVSGHADLLIERHQHRRQRRADRRRPRLCR